MYRPQLQEIEKAVERLKKVAAQTPLMRSFTYSNKWGSNVWIKREDLQQVRSYKIRGAYNKISSLPQEALINGIICASAGNHAQGVAFACERLKIHGTIVMPEPTPKQKIEQVKMFGKEYVEVLLLGDTFDNAYEQAMQICEQSQKTFIHPFNDEKIIEGQATVGLEIIHQSAVPIDYLFLPIGGGGLASGVSSVFKKLSPNTHIIGVEPEGAPSMKKSIEQGEVVKLEKIDKFVDGAAVQKVGDITFSICRENLDSVVTVPEGKVCETILDLYNKDAIVVEPAGALTLSALDFYAEEIKGKNVVCVISGSNNDITRTAEIKERALLYAGLKHYFIIEFPQRAGALKEFINEALGDGVDITYFQYTKRVNRESGPVVIGLELNKKEDFKELIQRFNKLDFAYEYLNDKPMLFNTLIN